MVHNNRLLRFLILCLSLGIFACNVSLIEDATTFDHDDFDATEYLESEPVEVDFTLRQPSLRIHRDRLFLFDDAGEKMVFAFNLGNLSEVDTLISKGAGPNELLSIWDVLDDGSHIWFHDLGQRKLLRTAWNKDGFDLSDSSTKMIELGEKLIHRLDFIDSSKFVGTSYQMHPLDRLLLIDSSGHSLGSFETYPKTSSSYTTEQLPQAFIANIAVKPDGTRIVTGHMMTDLIQIFSVEPLELLKSIHGPDQFLPVVETISLGAGTAVSPVINKSKDGHLSLRANNEKIFSFYSGRTLRRERSEESYHYDTIFQFDWDGKPIKKLILDRQIYFFDVDWENNFFYGITQIPNIEILRFKL